VLDSWADKARHRMVAGDFLARGHAQLLSIKRP
jgi:hypothetical protein